jgi:hypothetical protein
MTLSEFIDELNTLDLAPALAMKIVTLASRLASRDASRYKRDGSAERSRRYRANKARESTAEQDEHNPDRAVDRHVSRHADHHASERDGGDISDSKSRIQEVRKKNSEEVRKKNTTEFELFWNNYPKRVGKKDAAKAYEIARRDVSQETIMAGLNRIKPDWGDPKYIPHPSTWLRRGGWDDQPNVLPLGRPSTLSNVL